MVKAMTLVGLDVHARQTHAAVLDPATGELGVSKLRMAPEEVVSFLERLGPAVRAVYEAGPTGFGLARAARECGIEVRVAAPGSIPKGAGDRPRRGGGQRPGPAGCRVRPGCDPGSPAARARRGPGADRDRPRRSRRLPARALHRKRRNGLCLAGRARGQRSDRSARTVVANRDGLTRLGERRLEGVLARERSRTDPPTLAERGTLHARRALRRHPTVQGVLPCRPLTERDRFAR